MIDVPQGKHVLYYDSAEYSMPIENDLFFLNLIKCFIFSSPKSSDYYTQPEFHGHLHHELHYIYEGTCDFKLEDGSLLTVCEGEFVLFPPKYQHQILAESRPFGKMVVSFSISAKKNFYRTALKLAQKIESHSTNDSMVYLANAIAENILKKQKEYLNVVSFSQIALILESLRVIVGTSAPSSFQDTQNTRIRNAIDFIHGNISRISSVADVAEQLHISTKQLTRIFQDSMDITPGAYIKKYKIICVCDLLATTDLSVENISAFMNYPDASSLIKSFKRAKGMTPLQYRNSHNGIN